MNALCPLPLDLASLPFATGSTLGLVIWPLLVGLSCHWLLTAPWQPLGRPRPDLRERLRRLNVEEPSPHDNPARGPEALPLLPWPALDALLRPLLEDVSGGVRRVLVRFGLDGGREVAARLRLIHPAAEPDVLLEQFWGRKLLCALAPLALFLLVKLFGTRPLASWPLLAWLLLCAGGFLYPNYKLNWLVAERHAKIVTELPTVIDLLAIGLAGGQSLEQTLLVLPGESRGIVAREFATVLREVAASQRTLPHALEDMAARNDVPELTGLLTHLRASIEHGTADLVPILTAQAATLREQQRLRLLAEARRAQVRMLLPVGVGILPVLIVVLLAPAAMQLLGLGG